VHLTYTPEKYARSAQEVRSKSQQNAARSPHRSCQRWTKGCQFFCGEYFRNKTAPKRNRHSCWIKPQTSVQAAQAHGDEVKAQVNKMSTPVSGSMASLSARVSKKSARRQTILRSGADSPIAANRLHGPPVMDVPDAEDFTSGGVKCFHSLRYSALPTALPTG